MKYPDREFKEPQKAYQAFQFYLDLGERRNLNGSMKDSGLPTDEVVKLANKWNWESRAAGYEKSKAKDIITSNKNLELQIIEKKKTNSLKFLNAVYDALGAAANKAEQSAKDLAEKNIDEILKAISLMAKTFSDVIKNCDFEITEQGETKLNVLSIAREDEEIREALLKINEIVKAKYK